MLGRERFFEQTFARIRRGLTEVEVRHRTFEYLPRIVVESVFVCGVAALIALAQMRGSVDLVPLLGLFAYAGLRILPPLQEIVSRLNLIRFAQAPLEAVYRDWLRITEQGAVAAAEGPVSPLPFERELSVDGVGYRFEGAHRWALQKIEFGVRQGESVGIVGPTGAGKSTLVALLLGLLKPSEGHIAVDGCDIQERPRDWQRQIGYVPQEVYLTDDTIRRNVALGVEDGRIDEARVAESVRTAQLDDFVASLPEGLDTVVGERGVRLSGGQCQRIAVARALYRQPQVLVFDEATAALDHRTELELTRAIEGLHGTKTVLIVAHRLSTVRRCDFLVFLDEGRVAGLGTYDDLLANNAAFRHLATASRGEGS